MKTKKFLMKGLMVMALAALIITGCKKKNDDVEPDTTPTTTETTKNSNNAQDQTNVDQQSNESLDDVNAVLNENSNTRAKLPCNVDIDSSGLTKGLIKLTYNGLSCDGLRNRTGVISVQLPVDANGKLIRWSAKGAKIIIKYDKYKVTTVANNKSTIFNGEVTVTNVNGGGVWALITGTPIIHKLRGGMVITFDDGTTREWAVARTRTYTYAITVVLSVQDEGDTLIAGKKVAYWGKNRAGDQFWLSIDKPIITNIWGGQLCRLWRPYQGVVVLASTVAGANQSLTITYGVDVNGNPITGAIDCPYGYKVNWTDAAGTPQQLVIKY